MKQVMKHKPPFLTWEQMEGTLRAWHDQSVDDPLYLWLSPNFEEMADCINKAMLCAGIEVDMTPDNSWMNRQDGVQ